MGGRKREGGATWGGFPSVRARLPRAVQQGTDEPAPASLRVHITLTLTTHRNQAIMRLGRHG